MAAAGCTRSKASRIKPGSASKLRLAGRAPPQPGSILVADENEKWSAIHPRLESSDAEKDGLAIKKMIAAGAGVPMHFLAEPESSTRTTAEAAGGPTYRRMEQRQEFFLWVMQDILAVALRRRSKVDKKIDAAAEISVPDRTLAAGTMLRSARQPTT